MTFKMRIGASRDGTLLVKETTVLADNGAYSLHAPSVMGAATIRMDNLYRWRALRAHADLVYTNTLPTQCFRGFGSPQSGFAQEQLIDEIARSLGIDPLDLRKQNAVHPGDRTIHDWRLVSCGLTEALDAIADALDGDRRLDPPTSEGRFRIGYGVAAGVHVISDRSINPPGDGAWVRAGFEEDGRVHLYLSEVEVGAGTFKTMRQLLADAVSLSVDDVVVSAGDTERSPYGLGSWASRTTLFTGNAVLDAAQNLLARLAELRRELNLEEESSISEIVDCAKERGWLDRTQVEGEFVSKNVEVHDSSWFGNVSPTYTFAVHGCKVRVDSSTGKVEVLRYWAAHDSGKILNRAGAIGQVFGGVAQGLGYALSESVAYDDSGRVLNAGFLDYRVPTFADAVDTEAIFIETDDAVGPLGAKSIAEPPIIPVAACVANAVRDAIGVRITTLPITPENVYTATATAMAVEGR
jgi:CO/xanthine dehydrogenase Mo-binding subunit